MNWYRVFYWMSVADSAVTVFKTIAIASFVLVLIIGIILYITTNTAAQALASSGAENSDYKEANYWTRTLRRSFTLLLPICIIFTTATVLVPDKKQMLTIIVGGAVGTFVTTDSSAKAIPADVTKYLHTYLQEEIREMSIEERRDMGIPVDKKEDLVDKFSGWTKEQIVEYLKKDTSIQVK